MADFVEGRRHLCKNRRMPERVARHQGTDLHSTGRLGQRRQHGPAFPDSTGRLVRITIEEMVRKPDTIEPISLSLLRDRSDRIIRAGFVAFALVREKYHQPNLQGLLTNPLLQNWLFLAVRTESIRPSWKTAKIEPFRSATPARHN